MVIVNCLILLSSHSKQCVALAKKQQQKTTRRQKKKNPQNVDICLQQILLANAYV